MNIQTSNPAPLQNSPKRPPICGILSLLFPIVGITIAYIYAHGPGDEAGWGWAGAAKLVVIFFGSLVLGFISGIIGMFRAERLVVLSAAGMILNAVPVFYVLYYLG